MGQARIGVLYGPREREAERRRWNSDEAEPAIITRRGAALGLGRFASGRRGGCALVGGVHALEYPEHYQLGTEITPAESPPACPLHRIP